ncbi:MAG: flagellar assembly protein FliW [Candidatus Muirbacterium halophilum]|nr:flagellar assembly protein FliW [Candidatus Muirbacterium halophilum]MCK9474763.1 flagellar assembly protein FliW [Candidatus Muirbacterium halophilum]
MKLLTSRFGELEIKEEEVIYFKNGVFGFENFKKYILLNEGGSMFSWLQSIESSELAFVLVKPVEFVIDYILDIDEPDAQDLKIEENDDTTVFCIVIIPDDTSKMTGNLQGPIVINTTKNIGKQVISLNSKHKLKHPIVEELHKKMKKDKSSQKERED